MKDPFFCKNFLNFYKLHTIQTESFLYPFLLINYKGNFSISSLGYQGILIKKDYSDNDLKDFYNLREKFIKENNIVCEFIRYNPFLKVKFFENRVEASEFYIIDVINTPGDYFKSLPQRAKSSIKKNLSLLTIKQKIDFDTAKNFLNYRNEFFYDEKSLKKLLNSSFSLTLSAFYKDRCLATSLFFYSDDFSYYIANYSTPEGKKFSANTLILLKFYEFAYEKRIKSIGLGGGLIDGDSLSFFKKQFSTRNLKIIHSKIIHNKNKYDLLTKDINYDFFPPYLKDENLLKLSDGCSECY